MDREGADELDALADLERAADELLRELVGEDRRSSDREQRQPLRRPGRQRALRGRDRLQRVRRRADADIDLLGGSRAAGSLTSSALLGALVVDAERRPGNRLEALLRDRLAADAHVPYVPSSIRPSAASTSSIRWSAFSSRPSSSSRMYVSVAESASSPAPLERSPVSSITEPSWFTPFRAARSRSSSSSSSVRKWSRSRLMPPNPARTSERVAPGVTRSRRLVLGPSTARRISARVGLATRRPGGCPGP